MTNKDGIKANFTTGSTPSESNFAELIDNQVGVLANVSELPTASANNVGQKYIIGTVMYTSSYSGGAYSWVATTIGGGGGGTSSYNDLQNKPRINNIELTGNKSLQTLGIAERNPAQANFEEIITSVNEWAIYAVRANGEQVKLSFTDLKQLLEQI